MIKPLAKSIAPGLYCTWIENGEWKKTKGECDAVINPSPELTSTSTPEPTPSAEPGGGSPPSEPIPTPEPTPEPTPTQEPTPEPTPTPEEK